MSREQELLKLSAGFMGLGCTLILLPFLLIFLFFAVLMLTALIGSLA